MAASTSEAQAEGSSGLSHTPWHEHDWNALLAGCGTADRYFLRAGLIRKDRLSTFAPGGHHPQTAVLRSFEELKAAFQALGACDGTAGNDEHAVSFVLKKAHSSNAFGIRFLSLADARTVLGSSGAASTRLLHFAPLGCRQALGASALAAGAAAAVTACFFKTSHALKRTALSAAVLTATLGLAVFGYAGLAGSPCVAGGETLSAAESDVIGDLKSLLQPTISDGQEKAAVWVLQRHVEPWLHEGRKFHLRVLLLCVGDLRAYVHEDVRMLVATEPFRLGEGDGKRLLAHVTNMGASRKSPEYQEVAQNLPLAALGEEVARRVFDEVVKVLGVTLARLRAAGRRHFFTTPNCWEMFGVDFLVEGGSGRAVLLEVNPSPSLAMYGSGSGVRARLCGPNPLESVLPTWHEAPLDAVAASGPAAVC